MEDEDKEDNVKITILDKLPEKVFFRATKSTILNINKIKSLEIFLQKELF